VEEIWTSGLGNGGGRRRKKSQALYDCRLEEGGVKHEYKPL